ncbi:MAG: magnesium/cobalt transporter CorA, partial [Alphaproteobacteria bacterium]|nr:magnesium/cobalt transporter CorA [Alphaproteobacteria bacterium]
LADTQLIQDMGDLFGLHPLALEDVVNTHQRSKADSYEGNLFIVARMVTPRDGALVLEQVSLFLGKNFVLSFQERPGDCFDPVRERIRKGGRRVRLSQTDYLAYALLDALVDSYFPLLESFGDKLDQLEDQIVDGERADMMTDIHEIKRTLHGLRHVIWPLRDALGAVATDHQLVRDETRIFLRDCQDHVMQQLDILENYRERAAGLTDLYLSVLSLKTNAVMKVLTVIATIFMPLTFLVGVYGMNFNTALPGNMPELNWPYAYPVLWLMMLLLVVGMLYGFRRMGWLGSIKKGE